MTDKIITNRNKAGKPVSFDFIVAGHRKGSWDTEQEAVRWMRFEQRLTGRAVSLPVAETAA